jgi:hypothetical protein
VRFAWRWLVAQVSEALDLLPMLATGGVLTAAVVQSGHVAVEWMKGWNRRAEIKATSDADLKKLQLELQLERERNRALTSSQLSIGPPPPR